MANETARKLRKAMTPHESKLWLHLRELRKLGFHFRRQVPIDSFIVDFACFHPKVVVELDGSQHGFAGHEARDRARDRRWGQADSVSSGFGTAMLIPIWRVSSSGY
jgi:very-short-patch-repair endonuclease